MQIQNLQVVQIHVYIYKGLVIGMNFRDDNTKLREGILNIRDCKSIFRDNNTRLHLENTRSKVEIS